MGNDSSDSPSGHKHLTNDLGLESESSQTPEAPKARPAKPRRLSLPKPVDMVSGADEPAAVPRSVSQPPRSVSSVKPRAVSAARADPAADGRSARLALIAVALAMILGGAFLILSRSPSQEPEHRASPTKSDQGKGMPTVQDPQPTAAGNPVGAKRALAERPKSHRALPPPKKLLVREPLYTKEKIAERERTQPPLAIPVAPPIRSTKKMKEDEYVDPRPQLIIITEPAMMKVEVEGVLIGRTPVVKRLTVGTENITVVVSGHGFQTIKRTLEPDEQGRMQLGVRMQPTE